MEFITHEDLINLNSFAEYEVEGSMVLTEKAEVGSATFKTDLSE